MLTVVNGEQDRIQEDLKETWNDSSKLTDHSHLVPSSKVNTLVIHCSFTWYVCDNKERSQECCFSTWK